MNLGLFQLLFGDQLVVVKVFLAFIEAPVLGQLGLDLDPLGLEALDEGPIVVGVGFILGGIQSEEKVAALDLLPFLNSDLDDSAGDLGRQVDVLFRLDFPDAEMRDVRSRRPAFSVVARMDFSLRVEN